MVADIETDNQALDRQTFWNECLVYAKNGVAKGVNRFGVPVEILYAIADILSGVENLREILIIRVATIFGALAGLRVLSKIQSYPKYQMTYFGFVLLFSASTNYVVYLSAQPPGIYWAGLALVAFGGLGFYPFSKLYCAVQLLVLYMPPMLLAIRFHQQDGFMGSYIYLGTFFVATTAILWMFRDFQERLLFTEIEGRIRLQREVESKSLAMQDQENELGEAKTKLFLSQIKVKEVEAVASLARQAAHDIRSPLSALAIVTRSLQSLSSEHRDLAQAAVDRITKTAEELLAGAKGRPGGAYDAPGAIAVDDFLIAIDGVVREKLAFVSGAEISVVKDSSMDTTGKFIWGRIDTLARIVSNLLDNAIEASRGEPRITIKITFDLKSPASLQVSVSDCGVGIPESVLGRVGEQGFTHGKENGNGLGVYFAKSTLESWGGYLRISSSLGNGTSIEVGLPLRPKA